MPVAQRLVQRRPVLPRILLNCRSPRSWHFPCDASMPMGLLTTVHEPIAKNGLAKPAAPVPPPAPAAPKPVVGFHGAVGEFKRRLIEATLAQAGGNRTRAARALGLQRTYLLRHDPPGGFAAVPFEGVAMQAGR
jgi:DNA-binding NtrC family response regulator